MRCHQWKVNELWLRVMVVLECVCVCVCVCVCTLVVSSNQTDVITIFITRFLETSRNPSHHLYWQIETPQLPDGWLNTTECKVNSTALKMEYSSSTALKMEYSSCDV